MGARTVRVRSSVAALVAVAVAVLLAPMPPASAGFIGGWPFIDVPASAYYGRSADWLGDLGITTGYGGNPDIFAPNVSVTRAQMAAFL